MSQLTSPQPTRAVIYHTPISREELEKLHVGWVCRHIAATVGVSLPSEVKQKILLYVHNNNVKDAPAAPQRYTTIACVYTPLRRRANLSDLLNAC